MTADRFLRRGDDQLVTVLAFTGDSAAAFRAWLAGFRVADQERSLTRSASARPLPAAAGPRLPRPSRRAPSRRTRSRPPRPARR